MTQISLQVLLLLLIGFYLVGSIPFSFLAVRLRTGGDLRRSGSGNPGATNALRTAGPAIALMGLVLDVGKGFVPVWLGRVAGLPESFLAAGALACVLGHIFSPFLGFRGGKGVATGFGALGALNPLAVAMSFGVFTVALAASRIVSVASIVAVSTLPLLWPLAERFGFQTAGSGAAWLAGSVICALVLARHTGNLKRLRSGTESRLGGRSV